jgi:hypothetical protein
LDDYVRLYNAVVDVITGAAQEIGIAENEIRIGGPYVPIRVQTVRNASSLPEGHPLNGAWGDVRKEAIRFLEGFVRKAKRLDVLVVDMGLGITKGEPLVDDFTNCQRIRAITGYVREAARAAGWNVPMELAEFYLAPTDASSQNAEFRAAVAAEALRNLVEAGTGTAFAWGFRHGGQSAILTATNREDGGAPMPVWEVCRIFKVHFSRGRRIHKLTLTGERASAIANEQNILIINHSATPRTATVNGMDLPLSPYERHLAVWA